MMIQRSVKFKWFMIRWWQSCIFLPIIFPISAVATITKKKMLQSNCLQAGIANGSMTWKETHLKFIFQIYSQKWARTCVKENILEFYLRLLFQMTFILFVADMAWNEFIPDFIYYLQRRNNWMLLVLRRIKSNLLIVIVMLDDFFQQWINRRSAVLASLSKNIINLFEMLWFVAIIGKLDINIM